MTDETLVRLAAFFGFFLLFAVLEAVRPRRVRIEHRPRRWFTNLSLVAIDSATVQLMARILPFVAVGAAIDAGARGWGLFNALDWPIWIEVLLSVVALDFVIWAQHLLVHKVPLLWRFHRVHHADRDYDVSTALRFHPVEIAFSMLIKMGAVYVLGPLAFAVILFEIILNGTAMFNHANLRLPPALDGALRLILVTPDMHRVHHSVHRDEHDSNYGFALSIWDRLLGTYIAEPKDGHEAMTIGLQWQDERPGRLGWALAVPFFRT